MNFLLMHGGWQGGWAWDDVTKRLQAAGHTVLAPTAPGSREQDGDDDRLGVNLTRVGESIVDVVCEQDLSEVVAVGHSGGGPIIAYVADRCPERIRHTIFVDAWVLYDGESVFDVVPPEFEVFRELAQQRPDNSVPLAPEIWESSFINGATSEQLAATTPRLVPHPLGQLDEGLSVPRFWSLDLPASYIFLKADIAVPPTVYRTMASRLKDPTIIECDGPHQAMMTHPEEMTRAILAAAPSD